MSAATPPRGLLYVEVDCPPELEGEFHAWYNLEHVPERLKIPGFVTGRRYAALEGSPRWLAAYELTTVDVLESPDYRQWLGGPLQTAWTTRMLSCTQIHRSVFRLISRTDSPAVPARPSGLLTVRYEAASGERASVHQWHDLEFLPAVLGVAGVARVARYENTEGPEQLSLYELEQPWVVQHEAFARLWRTGWDNHKDAFTRYRRTLYIRIL